METIEQITEKVLVEYYKKIKLEIEQKTNIIKSLDEQIKKISDERDILIEKLNSLEDKKPEIVNAQVVEEVVE